MRFEGCKQALRVRNLEFRVLGPKGREMSRCGPLDVKKMERIPAAGIYTKLISQNIFINQY